MQKHPFGSIYWHVSGIVERPHPFFNPVADPSSHQTSIFDSHQLASFEFPRGWHHGMSMLSRNTGKSPKWSTYLPTYSAGIFLMETSLCFGHNLPLTPNYIRISISCRFLLVFSNTINLSWHRQITGCCI